MQVLVIGGGPAGMMAAGIAAENGAHVCLVEKNEKLGVKLRITGKGRCNLTNACTHEELIQSVLSNPRFMHSAFRAFSNHDLMAFTENLGVKLKIERGNRVFPVSDDAREVVGAYKKWLTRLGVITVQSRADALLIKNGAVCGVRFGKKCIGADAVVLATGGMSYPQTGSTGDGYKIAEDAGHEIVMPRPSLVPLISEEQFDLAGLSLRNISFSIFQNEKEIYTDFGEMLFTHDGISGPVVLSASAHMRDAATYQAKIDFKPALTNEMMDKRLLRDFEKYNKKDLIHAMADLLPARMIEAVIQKAGLSARKKAGLLTREERQSLGKVLKNFMIDIKGFRPIREAIVTAGGVKTDEINPKTMESKKVHGLYFAGEIIDVDAYTGGFNLQIAFSTGYAAGKAIGEKLAING